MLFNELFESQKINELAPTGGASTYSTITNPETGKLYTKAELRSKYGDVAPEPNANTVPVPSQATVAPPATPEVTPQVNKFNTAQAKKDINKIITAIGQMTPRGKKSALAYGQQAFAKAAGVTAPTQTAVEPTVATTPTWTGRGKIAPTPSPGAPTAAERAKLDQKIQQALDAQSQPVTESKLVWSADFDPSETLLRKIR